MLLKSSDVARILNDVCTKTVDRMRERGEINWLRVGRQVRFRPEHVEEYLCLAHESTFNAAGLDAHGISAERIAQRKREQRMAAAVQRGREIARKVPWADELRAERGRRRTGITGEIPAKVRGAKIAG